MARGQARAALASIGGGHSRLPDAASVARTGAMDMEVAVMEDDGSRYIFATLDFFIVHHLFGTGVEIRVVFFLLV